MSAYVRNPQTIPDDTPGGSTTRQAVKDQNNQAIDDLFVNLNSHSNNENGRSHVQIDEKFTSVDSEIAVLQNTALTSTVPVFEADAGKWLTNDGTTSFWADDVGLHEGDAELETGTLTLDYSTGVVFSHTAAEDFTVTVDNLPAGKTAIVLLKITNGGAFAVTWPTGTKWPSGTAPTLTETGLDHIFLNRDSGGGWSGVVQLDVKAAE